MIPIPLTSFETFSEMRDRIYLQQIQREKVDRSGIFKGEEDGDDEDGETIPS